MSELSESLELDKYHLEILDWFISNSGKTFTPSELVNPIIDGPRVITRGNHIYISDQKVYALSIQVSPSDPPNNEHLEIHLDGTWTYWCKTDIGRGKDSGNTNYYRLSRNESDNVPIGVFLADADHPKHLIVLGSARISNHTENNFHFKLFGTTPIASNVLEVLGASNYLGHKHISHMIQITTDVRSQLSTKAAEVSPEWILSGTNTKPAWGDDIDQFVANHQKEIYLERIRTENSIQARQGQAEFRNALLEAYDGKCAITNYSVPQTLEACHIVPYCGPETSHPYNGILLRGDIHTLFDRWLIAVDTSTLSLVLADELKGTEYEQLRGANLRLPRLRVDQPRVEALNWHFQRFGTQSRTQLM